MVLDRCCIVHLNNMCTHTVTQYTSHFSYNCVAIYVVVIYISAGFSFGGTLAQLCATHLWSLSQSICPELLEKNLLCITYGQPIISLPRIEDFAHVNADKSRFYAIYISDDIIPMVMRYLDPVYTDKSTHELMERFRKENSPNEVQILTTNLDRGVPRGGGGRGGRGVQTNPLTFSYNNNQPIGV